MQTNKLSITTHMGNPVYQGFLFSLHKTYRNKSKPHTKLIRVGLYLFRKELYEVMYNTEAPNTLYSKCIGSAIESLRQSKLEKAYAQIVEAMRLYPNAPEPHNLLGIWFEIKGDDLMARRHYRAAYSLDPTFKPACKNIDRICT